MEIFSSSGGLLIWMLLFVLKGLRRICEHTIWFLEIIINICSDGKDGNETHRTSTKARENSPRTNLHEGGSTASENRNPSCFWKRRSKQHIQDRNIENSSDSFVDDEKTSKEEKKVAEENLAKQDFKSMEEDSKHLHEEKHVGTDSKASTDSVTNEHETNMFECDQVDSNSAYYKESPYPREKDTPTDDEFLCRTDLREDNKDDKQCQRNGFSDDNASLFTTKTQIERKQIQHMHENLSMSEISFNKNTGLCHTDFEEKNENGIEYQIRWIRIIYIKVLCLTSPEMANGDDIECQWVGVFHVDTSAEMNNDHFQLMLECILNSLVTSDENTALCLTGSKEESKDGTECQRVGYPREDLYSNTTTEMEADQIKPVQYSLSESKLDTYGSVVLCLTNPVEENGDDIVFSEGDTHSVTATEIETNKTQFIPEKLPGSTTNANVCLTNPKEENEKSTECKKVDFPHVTAGFIRGTEIETEKTQQGCILGPLATSCEKALADTNEENEESKKSSLIRVEKRCSTVLAFVAQGRKEKHSNTKDATLCSIHTKNKVEEIFQSKNQKYGNENHEFGDLEVDGDTTYKAVKKVEDTTTEETAEERLFDLPIYENTVHDFCSESEVKNKTVSNVQASYEVFGDNEGTSPEETDLPIDENAVHNYQICQQSGMYDSGGEMRSFIQSKEKKENVSIEITCGYPDQEYGNVHIQVGEINQAQISVKSLTYCTRRFSLQENNRCNIKGDLLILQMNSNFEEVSFLYYKGTSSKTARARIIVLQDIHNTVVFNT